MNKILPIYDFKDEIVKTIQSNAVTIIVAETGSGKSTQVPQMLLEATIYNIVVTQPRRIAAKSISRRIAEEMQVIWGETVAYRTSFDGNNTEKTRCLFCTDGLQLVKELTKARLMTTTSGVVLIIDEIHEWNISLEGLVAWAKHKLLDSNIKIVLMSATIDSANLSMYFGNAPVINVPGKNFPVFGSPIHGKGLNKKRANDLIPEIEKQVAAGRNCLVFLAGKPEIYEVNERIAELDLQAEVFELHGDLNPEEQDKVFQPAYLPKVVLATNVAQTSITIPDIDCVIDSGMEKRIELQNGVHALVPTVISKADVIQRAGRAGRVREGHYVLCHDLWYERFPEYPKPDILRIKFDHLVLRFISAGIDPMTLDFYHQPSQESLLEAKRNLFIFGAIDQNGDITQLGRQICRMPTSVETSIMIMEAIRTECLQPVMTIAAILESHCSTIRRIPQRDDTAEFKSWRELIGDTKYKSDLLVDLELYSKAITLNLDQLEMAGISLKAYLQINEIRARFLEAIRVLGCRTAGYFNENAANTDLVIKCIFAGMVRHLYRKDNNSSYKNGTPILRKLHRDSILSQGDLPEFLVGIPKNLIKTLSKQSRISHIITNCTIVRKEWVLGLDPKVTKELAIELQ